MSRSAINLLMENAAGTIDGISPYILKKKAKMTPEAWQVLRSTIAKSCTIYVGNLAFSTSESQIYDYFSQVGQIKRVIMVR